MIIPLNEISQVAKYYNYDSRGVTVQLVALKDKNGSEHIAFNTCQSCSPSPKAFYTQSGEVLQCTNCRFTFAPEQVGITHGGCNPWPVEGVIITGTQIIIPVSSLNGMRDVFSTWEGPGR